MTKREYTQLMELYNKYQGAGLEIVGFPSNEFGGQEPGDAATIRKFVTEKFGVTFLMMEKTTVNSSGAHPVFKFLKANATKKETVVPIDTIRWNFTKFLVNKDASAIERYEPTTPAGTLAPRIEAMLAESAL